MEDLLITDLIKGSSETEAAPAKQTMYAREELANIDPGLTPADLMTVIDAEIRRKGIAGHHLDSMNSFTSEGIRQIVTKVFQVEGKLRNLRDKTDEDKSIANIEFKVTFTDINLSPPITTMYVSGTTEMLTPNMARVKNLTYSSPMTIDADIEAKAIMKNGSTKTRSAQLRNHMIGSVPCMVKSELCNTYGMSRETLKELQEDPTDPGGYFIIKGGEWAVDCLENVTNNTFHVHMNFYANEIARGTFLSKPGDAFENSYQILMKYLNNGAIVLELTTNKVEKLELPFYLLFRACGMVADREIFDNIVYGVENTDYTTVYMLEILEKALNISDPKWAPIMKSYFPNDIVEFIGNKIIEAANAIQARKDENVQKYINSNFLGMIDRYIFPHIGVTSECRVKKLRFLGHLINKLLRVVMGASPSTDRDDYGKKRVDAAGRAIAKAFKTDFNFVGAQAIKKKLIKEFKTTPFGQVPLAESVKSAIDADDLEHMLIQSITTGNKTIMVRRSEITNRVSSQTVYRKNDLNVKSILNMVNTPNTSASKQNERADEMRRVHASYPGYIDISQSADTGEKVGQNKQLACTASISGASSSYVLKDILAADGDVLNNDKVTPAMISGEKLAKIFVNGDWIGCCRAAHVLVARYRSARRWGDIHQHTSIVWEPLVREVYFWTDVGRLLRPLIIVYNNIEEYKAARRAGDKKYKFQQWIKLTKAHITGLQTGRITMDDLRTERIVEYISPEEQENLQIAFGLEILRDAEFDVTKQFTHCEIDQAIFGIVALASPLANHSNAVRITYYTNHRKQSAGWYALNWPYRIDKNVSFQHYGERPLVSCFSDNYTGPNGHNCIVAMMLYGGLGQEDGIIGNKSSVDCSMFNMSFFNFEKTELEKGENFDNPSFEHTMDIKRDANYEWIENGVIKEGHLAQKGDVLIVKSLKMPQAKENYQYIDKSIVYKRDESVWIDKAIIARGDDGVLFAKVKTRADRPMNEGDKLCLTPDHEVLTLNRSWIPIAEVTLDDEVACLNPVTDCLEYHFPDAIHEYDHMGDMYEIESNHVNLCVTLNHKMYIKRRGKDNYEFAEARSIIGKRVQYKRNADMIAQDIPTITLDYPGDVSIQVNMDYWLDMLGIFISDGCVRLGTNSIDYTATKQRKIDHINTFARNLGVEVKHYNQRGKPVHHVITNKWFKRALTPLSVGAPNKFLPSYVWLVSKRQANILLDSLISGDGTKDATHVRYTTTSKRLADDVMQLALHCGYSANILVKKCAGNETIMKDGHIIHANYDELIVTIVRRCNNPMMNHPSILHQDGQSERVFQYNGKVHCLTVATGIFYVRRRNTPVWTGNSSRSGNKGVLLSMLPREDMPFSEDGLIPDLIVNPHSIPTRMAVNQLLECFANQLSIARGTMIDATTFKTINIDAIEEELQKEGIKFSGHRRLFNGKTGEWMNTLIFIGPTCYQRLQKFVIDENYAVRRGPTSALTRQPIDGRTRDGGLRLGEMEINVMESHGTMRALYEKFYEDSDGCNLAFCRNCGNQAIVNEKLGLYRCKYCGDAADIANVPSAWVANLFFNEASAINTKMHFKLTPFEFTKNE